MRPGGIEAFRPYRGGSGARGPVCSGCDAGGGPDASGGADSVRGGICKQLKSPNPRIESRQRSTDLLIPLPGLVVGRHSRYETAMESKIVTRPLFHTPKAPIRVFWTDRSRKGRQISTHFVK